MLCSAMHTVQWWGFSQRQRKRRQRQLFNLDFLVRVGKLFSIGGWESPILERCVRRRQFNI
jgi:hypothetical protein